MKIIVNSIDYKNAIDLCSKKFSGIIIIGIKNFSNGSSCKLSKNQILALQKIAIKHKKQIFVLLDIFIFEDRLKELEYVLNFLNEIKISGIVFNDFSINQISWEKKYNFKLFYDPKTLVTNYGQFDFYRKNNISAVFLSNYLKEKEIKEMGKQKKCELIIQSSGYSFIMNSRWNIISAFCEKNRISDNLKYKKLYIMEHERKFPSIIIENNFGTSIYSAYELSLIDKLDFLQKNNIDYIFIDSYLHDSKWLDKTINLYIDALCDKNYSEKKDIYLEKNKKISKLQNLSHGFFTSDGSELYYLKKEIKKR